MAQVTARDPFAHSSDDAPPMPRRERGTRDPLLPSRNVVTTLARVARALTCPECGGGFDLTRPADPKRHPPREKERDELLLTYYCDEGHPGQVSTADLTRAIRADRAGKGPAYLAAFDGVFRVVLSGLKRAHRSRNLEMVASLAEKATRMIALNLKLGGVLVDRHELEVSGEARVVLSTDDERAIEERVQRRISEIGRTVTAEVVARDGRRTPA